MQHNVHQELSSNCFNYGAYHTLEAVSISEQAKIRSLSFGFCNPSPYFQEVLVPSTICLQ